MIYTKNAIFHATLIIAIITSNYNYTSFWKPAGTAAIKDADTLLKNHLPEIGKAVAKASLQLGENAVKELGEDMIKASPLLGANFGIKAAETLASAGPVLSVAAGTVVAIHGVVQLYPIGKEIASYCFPGKEQKALSAERLKSAQQRLDLLDAERAFRQ